MSKDAVTRGTRMPKTVGRAGAGAKSMAKSADKASLRRAPAATAPRVRASRQSPLATPDDNAAASRQIDARIEALADWRGEMLGRIRTLIRQAVPNVVEEWKWRGVPVWSHAGILCTGESYKDVVKTTFAKGAALDDPRHLFNASLEGNTRRAIDFREGEKIDAAAFRALVRAAASANERSRSGIRAASTAKKAKRA